jgi:hypothetical protein
MIHSIKGSFAITSIMTKSCLDSLEGKYYGPAGGESLNASQTSESFLASDPTEAKIKISMTVTLLTGLIQV